MIPLSTQSRRPRNVDATRAAAILYGDWGTSKAYVVGLAFAVAGYSSFWLIAAMCVLVALVGVNYATICKHYPEGGGVYASVRHRSEIISIVGAFLLIADYIVTAAISAFSAFSYLRVPHPALCSSVAILAIGGLNLFGPKTTGGLAFLVSVPTAIVVVLLGAVTLPHLGAAVHHLQPLHGGVLTTWSQFVGIVLALSGVEAIANATGVMKLDPGSSPDQPRVIRTSTPAIMWVLAEVCLFTALLGLAMHALPGLEVVPAADGSGNEVNAPGQPGVRDYMLRYMAETFVGPWLGPFAGGAAGLVVSIVFGFLLLSAVNTAIVDLIAIFFLMSRDRELPRQVETLNRHGVPTLGLVIATVVPAILVVAVGNLNGLADLYAVGVVGAIATNLGATSTDRKLRLDRWERRLMFVTFLVMLAIELSLFIDKPQARIFAVTILAIGLTLRALAREKAQRGTLAIVLVIVAALLIDALFVLRDPKTAVQTGIIAVSVLAAALIVRGLAGERAQRRQLAASPGGPEGGNGHGNAGLSLGVGTPTPEIPGTEALAAAAAGRAGAETPAADALLDGTPMLCAVRGTGRTLDFAVDEAKETHRPLYLLFVREQFVITSEDTRRKWQQDEEARVIFQYAKQRAAGHIVLPCYAVSDSTASTIVDVAATVGASRLVLGATSRSGIAKLMRGDIIRQVADLLPEDIHLLVYA